MTLLQRIKKLRERNNAEWMKLIQIGLEADETKRKFLQVMRRIEKNDKAIQKALKTLTRKSK